MAIRSENDVMATLMRGSTPLAVFENEAEARAIADHLNHSTDHADWWVGDHLPSDDSQDPDRDHD